MSSPEAKVIRNTLWRPFRARKFVDNYLGPLALGFVIAALQAGEFSWFA
jgi:hypothetical protein